MNRFILRAKRFIWILVMNVLQNQKGVSLIPSTLRFPFINTRSCKFF